MAYVHMWHDGKPFEQQCEGCTLSTRHMQMLDYLHARGVTYAVFSEGPYDESAAFAATSSAGATDSSRSSDGTKNSVPVTAVDTSRMRS